MKLEGKKSRIWKKEKKREVRFEEEEEEEEEERVTDCGRDWGMVRR